MIFASVYLLVFIQNLFVHLAEKILLLKTTNFRGYYRGISVCDKALAACQQKGGERVLWCLGCGLGEKPCGSVQK